MAKNLVFIQRCGAAVLVILIAQIPLILMPAPASAGTLVAGLISVDTVWDAAGSPYWVLGDLTVVSGASLTVQSGAEVRFEGYRTLYVDGSLKVNGTASQRVLFSSNSTALPRSWRSIQVNASGSVSVNFARIEYASDGLLLFGGSGRSIANTTFQNNSFGVTADSISQSVIIDCRFENHSSFMGGTAVVLYLSSDNRVVRNVFTTSTWSAISLADSSNNSIYHNNFLENPIQAQDNRNDNSWNNTYPIGGNYWSDYTGIDQFSGPNQDQPGSDGIGDIAYSIDPNSSDSYPLMEPLILDDIPPGVSISNPIDGQWFGTADVTVSGNAYDTISGLDRVQVSCDDGATWNTAMGTTWWTYDCTGLAEGTDVIAARAFDAFGLESAHATIVVHVDLTAPVVTITSPPDGAWSNTSSVTISGMALDSGGSGIDRIEVSCDGGSVWSPATGTDAWAHDCVGLTSGANSIGARAFDLVGLESAHDFITVNLDSLPPVVTITFPTDGQWLNSTAIIISGTAADFGSGIDRIEVSCDGGGTWNVATGTNSWTYYCIGLVEGQNNIHANAFDAVGRESSGNTVTVNVDSTPPVVVINSPADNLTIGTSSLAVSGTASDNVAVSAIKVRTGAGGWINATGTASWGTVVTLTAGDNIIDVQAFDVAGNPSAIASIRVFFDNEKPSIAITCNGLTVEVGSTVTCIIAATDNRGTPDVSWVVRKEGSNVTSGVGNTISFTAAETGDYAVEASAVDSVGNIDTANRLITAERKPWDAMPWVLIIVLIGILALVIILLMKKRRKKSKALTAERAPEKTKPL